ncbi:hypothetical protein KC340_g6923 [Hortaea werneckii]|nr:hypothetical protein KC342_g5609 [Hortaea werneckii]KAI7100497.1 hypothetical protein KC339_g7447 [Hortaea werneckii]KAI7239164.1 hypothetical protein KC365_g4198 [Hortaea werneckii]KAI7322763.1 hypothetical protein KC340_g6923 [Hortaea werneckii]KAI7393402.1 hypothetical protein KC328_g6617 [Hortaea werneckii]
MSNKVQVNGASSGVEPALQSQITTALLQNGGVKRIQDTLKQRLDEEGWSENLRNHVTAMFRSGEAITYDDAMAKVLQQIRAGQEEGSNGAHASSLAIPQSAKDGGVEVVRKELMGICEMDK